MLFDTRFAPWQWGRYYLSPDPRAEGAAQRSKERPAALSFSVGLASLPLHPGISARCSLQHRTHIDTNHKGLG